MFQKLQQETRQTAAANMVAAVSIQDFTGMILRIGHLFTGNLVSPLHDWTALDVHIISRQIVVSAAQRSFFYRVSKEISA